jgi:hypothetical protein
MYMHWLSYCTYSTVCYIDACMHGHILLVLSMHLVMQKGSHLYPFGHASTHYTHLH